MSCLLQLDGLQVASTKSRLVYAMQNRKRDVAGGAHIAMDRAGVMVAGSAVVNDLNLQ